ncbi:phage protein Gp36 family protein [Mycobacteroides abscessus]|uniref:phage protein Gp36 family protein n=1 Tax=Mycobacteroides abscessus TaxID=36809 RepID=UPI000C2576BB|nr:phage protein Gp36 family protein [Mycobacteroides abscessus]
MPTVLAIESFSETNIRERTVLTAGAVAGDTSLTVESTQGYQAGDILYVGQLSREGCEKAVVDAVTDATTLTLVSALTLAHKRFDAVTSVLGNKINIYRAANVDGKVPDNASFSVLAEREIDPDQESTYYRDPDGDSSYWYRHTYYNPTTEDETSLDASDPRRGDDFGHYASLPEIRKEAGFDNAHNLNDLTIDQQRRAAESEINTALSSRYTTPFNPVPEIIHTLTVQLAAGLLLQNAYRGTDRGKDKLKAARDLIYALQVGDQTITDENGNAVTSGEGIASWPGEEQPRAFHMGDRF